MKKKTNQQDNTSTTVIVEETKEDESTIEVATDTNKDNLSSEERISKYGAFAMSAYGSDDTIIIENDKLEVTYFCKRRAYHSCYLKRISN